MKNKSFARLLLCVSIPCAGRAQNLDLDNFNPLSARSPGVHLYGLNGSFGYYSGTALLGLTGLLPSSTSSRPMLIQGSAVVGWSRRGEFSQAVITYSPSYFRSLNLSSYESLNHALSGFAHGKLSTKWSLSGSFQGTLSDFSQLLFAQSPGTRLTSAAGSFDDLVSAILGNTSVSGQLGAIAGAAPGAASPESSYVFGSRLLSVGAATSLSYDHTSRSSMRLTFSGVQTQFLLDRTSANPVIDRLSSQLPRATSVSGGIGWSYLVTPRTTLGLNLASVRTVSQFQDGYTTHASLSVGRKLTPKLFVRGSAGAGRFLPLRETFARRSPTQQEFGGAIGYKLFAHTLVASADRAASDPYGFGADATVTGSGAWTWRRPGSSISITSVAGYSEMTGPRFPNSGSWTAYAGIAKALDAHSSISVAYRYLRYPERLLVGGSERRQSGITITFSWSPSPREARGGGDHDDGKEEKP